MVNKDIKERVSVLWEYMKLNQKLIRSDCILGLGCQDTNVAKRCAELYLSGYSDVIIFSGGLGKITEKIWKKSEAEKFAEIAIQMGVPESHIYIESSSTNTGDNLILTKKLIEEKHLSIGSLIVVTKPCAERRIKACFEKQMPGYSAIYTSPQFSFDEYLKFYEDGPVSQETLINALVGDIQRFDIYYKKGFQVYVEVPENVLKSYEELIALGFDKFLIKA